MCFTNSRRDLEKKLIIAAKQTVASAGVESEIKHNRHVSARFHTDHTTLCKAMIR